MLRTHLLSLVILVPGLAAAHDTWVQTNTQLVRVGDAVHVDLVLGNHGNDHRDFKLASKVDPAGGASVLIAPSGKRYDLADRFVDLGYAPKEGFHSAKLAVAEPGLYTVVHVSDRIVNHGEPARSLKSAKAYFIASASLDKPNPHNPGFDKPLGHPLEIVPQANPVLPMGPGQAIRVRVLLKGQPLAEARVSFIPRGETLAEGFDERYERKTDAKGDASFTPTTGNYYLVVVHHVSPDEKGAEYVQTNYSATLALLVPEVCPCCDE
ncbi:MAG TPA: DUF4198 domain-containing protein [Pirellulaceae bacterium]|jgi:uncharacterized GH25 family protein